MKITIGARCLNHLNGKTYYVSSLPRRRNGQPMPGFADFGYTDKVEGYDGLDKAIHLSPYWQKCFLKLRESAPLDSVRVMEIDV